MRLLITGATGFLGSRTLEFLCEKNEIQEIVATGRKFSQHPKLVHPKVQYLLGDLEDSAFVSSLFANKLDLIINCASLSSPWGTYSEFYSANIKSQKHLIQKAKKHEVKKFIYISSPSVFFNYKDQIFAEAGVDVATIILTKEKIDKNEITLIEVENSIEKQLGKKPQVLWKQDKEQIFNLNKEFEIKFDDCVALNEICTSYFGIQAYDRKSTVSLDKLDVNHLPIIDGGDINSFSYSLPTKYFNFLPEKIKSGGNYKVYNEKRIVISQIGFTPIVGVCEKGILGSNTLYNINLKPNSKFHLNFLLSILKI